MIRTIRPPEAAMQVPAPFEYERAESVEHAISLLDRLGEDARLIAGGHSLLPMMKLRLANVEYLIDINDLRADLGFITIEDDEIRIGALTRHHELLASTTLATLFPVFADAERLIADPVVRNWGTLGGSLCQADPSEDLTAVCTLLDARCIIRSTGGDREVSMADFHRGPYETAVGPAEMLTEVRIPIRSGGSSAYQKVKRRAGDWAIAASAAAVWMDDDVVSDAHVALAAVGAPQQIDASAVLGGHQRDDADAISAVGELAAEAANPVTDSRGSAEYKRHLARELTVRALRTALARIIEES